MLISTYNMRDTVAVLSRVAAAAKPDDRIVVTCPNMKTANAIALEFLSCRKEVHVECVNQCEDDVRAQLNSGVNIVFMVATRNTQKIRGYRATDIIVDEVQYIPDEMLVQLSLALAGATVQKNV